MACWSLGRRLDLTRALPHILACVQYRCDCLGERPAGGRQGRVSRRALRDGETRMGPEMWRAPTRCRWQSLLRVLSGVAQIYYGLSRSSVRAESLPAWT